MSDLVEIPLPDGSVVTAPAEVADSIRIHLLPGLSAVPNVIQCLTRAAAAVGSIEKDGIHGDPKRNDSFRYRSIEAILAKAGPALHDAGVVVIPTVVKAERLQKPRGANQALWDHVVLRVRYRFYGPAGDFVEATVDAEGLDNADKGTGKAMTMAYKTALLQVLNIASDVDPDAANPADEGPSQVREARPARRPAARKAGASTKSAGSSRKAPTPAEQVKPLVVLYGAEHAAEVEALIVAMNAVEPTSRKKALKDRFVATWGRPSELAPDALQAASGWVGEHLAPPEPEAAEEAPEAASGS